MQVYELNRCAKTITKYLIKNNRELGVLRKDNLRSYQKFIWLKFHKEFPR